MSVYGIKENKCLAEVYDKVQADKTFWPNGGAVLYEGAPIWDGTTVNCSSELIKKIKSYHVIALIYEDTSSNESTSIVLNRSQVNSYSALWRTLSNVEGYVFGLERVFFSLGEATLSISMEGYLFKNTNPYVTLKNGTIGFGFGCNKIVGIC